MILLQSTHSGLVVFPSASANPNRLVGINNRSGSARIIANVTGGDTGIYGNEFLSQIASNSGVSWYVSDGDVMEIVFRKTVNLISTIMKNYIQKLVIALALGSFSVVNAQVISNQPVNSGIAGQNPFFDAATNFSDLNTIGKGLAFPRTDLTTWTFVTDALDGINFPTGFDGMLVYNTGTGSTIAGQGLVAEVAPGFYYFSNPSGN